jgi:hypothetical protein
MGPGATARHGKAGFQPRRKAGDMSLLPFAASFPRAFDFAFASDSAVAFSICSSFRFRRSNRNTTQFKNRRNPLQTKHKTFSNRNNKSGVAVSLTLGTSASAGRARPSNPRQFDVIFSLYR